MKIDIVIPCSSEDSCVIDSLRAIQKAADSENSLQSIFIVFNPYIPNWATELLQIDSRVVILNSSVRNVNVARNIGLQNSKAEVCLFLDADCEVDYDLIARHLEFHQQQPDVTAIGGLYSSLKCKTRVQQAYDWLQKKWLFEGQLVNGNNPNLLGGNVSYKRSLLGDKVFCPSISFGASETELHYRLLRKNHKLVLNSKLIVHHKSSVTLFSLIKKAFLQGRHSDRLNLKAQQEQKILSLDFLYFIESKPKEFRFQFLLLAYAFSFKIGQKSIKYSRLKAFFLTLQDYAFEAFIVFQDHAEAYALRNQKTKRLTK